MMLLLVPDAVIVLVRRFFRFELNCQFRNCRCSVFQFLVCYEQRKTPMKNACRSWQLQARKNFAHFWHVRGVGLPAICGIYIPNGLRTLWNFAYHLCA